MNPSSSVSSPSLASLSSFSSPDVLARLGELIHSFNQFKSIVIANERALDYKINRLQSHSQTDKEPSEQKQHDNQSLSPALLDRLAQFESELADLSSTVRSHDSRLSAIERQLAIADKANSSAAEPSRRIRLHVRLIGVPMRSGRNNPICALFVQHRSDSDVLALVSQTEWLHDTAEARFAQPLEFDYSPASKSPCRLKVNLYDTASERVEDSDRLGSIILDVKQVLESEGREIEHSFVHEAPEKAGRIADCRLFMRLEGAQRSLTRTQSSSGRLQPSLSDSSAADTLSTESLSTFSFHVSCRSLPIPPGGSVDPMVALFTIGDGGRLIQFASQSEVAVRSPSPEFGSLLTARIPESQVAGALLQFSVYNMKNGASAATEENQIGFVIVQLDDLLAAADSEVAYDLMSTTEEKTAELAQSQALICISLADADPETDQAAQADLDEDASFDPADESIGSGDGDEDDLGEVSSIEFPHAKLGAELKQRLQ
jgi:hypothetical protein